MTWTKSKRPDGMQPRALMLPLYLPLPEGEQPSRPAGNGNPKKHRRRDEAKAAAVTKTVYGNQSAAKSELTPAETERNLRFRMIFNQIRQVRAAARQLFAILTMAETAAATIERTADGDLVVNPGNEAAHQLLALTMGKTGKAMLYSARNYAREVLIPDYMSFVWDELRAAVCSCWLAKDAEFPKASRGWLVLQMVRNMAFFNRLGISFPAENGRPVLEEHRVVLRWKNGQDPIEFRVGSLDPGRWYTWKRIVNGDWKHGTVRLTANKRKGKTRLELFVSYYQPVKPVLVEPGRVLTVKLSEKHDSLQLTGPVGEALLDEIRFSEVIGWLTRLKVQSDMWLDRKKACGSPNKPWGEPRRFHRLQDHLDRVTLCRRHGANTRNHAWAKRIVTRCLDWRCSTVDWAQLSDKQEEATIGGHVWGWADLNTKVQSKLTAAVKAQQPPSAPPATTPATTPVTEPPTAMPASAETLPAAPAQSVSLAGEAERLRLEREDGDEADHRPR